MAYRKSLTPTPLTDDEGEVREWTKEDFARAEFTLSEVEGLRINSAQRRKSLP